MGQKSLDKQKAKEMQKAIDKLQKELGKEIIGVFEAAKKPLDIAEIMELYPENERKKESDEKTLKSYIQMGLGPLVHGGKLKELPISDDGRYRLELV
jgi:hypothetical protein